MLEDIDLNIEWHEGSDLLTCEESADSSKVNLIKGNSLEGKGLMDMMNAPKQEVCGAAIQERAGGEDTDKCLCYRFAVGDSSPTSYMKTCGSCKMSLVPDDLEGDMQRSMGVGQELGQKIMNALGGPLAIASSMRNRNNFY